MTAMTTMPVTALEAARPAGHPAPASAEPEPGAEGGPDRKPGPAPRPAGAAHTGGVRIVGARGDVVWGPDGRAERGERGEGGSGGLEMAVDAVLERLVAMADAPAMPVMSRGSAAEPPAGTESEAWTRWWCRFEPARERRDLPAIRGMILGLMAGYGLSRLIQGVPERSLTRRVCDVVEVLARLRSQGEIDLVTDLAALALRRLETDEILAANPCHWAWDAAEDLRAMSGGSGELVLVPG